MKKIIGIILAIITIVSCVFAFAACSKGEKVEVKSIELTAESYAFIVKKGNTTMQTAANELLASLKASGELDAIINSFFDGSATFEYTNPASKDGCLVVATNAYFPPFEYYNGNKLTGVDMKIASLLAAKLNKTLYILDEDFDAIFTSVNAGEADIGMAGITVTAARQEIYDFTNEYYESAQVIVVKESDTLFDNCTTAADVEKILSEQDKSFIVGAQNGTTGYMYSAGDEDFGYDGFANLTVNGYKTGALAIKDLSNGKINAVILDKQPALMIAKATNK
ncbi:MAG: transporter substrate-binding domain-containing protein [Clostridia bacterium]|nr:transporter substrate-binding domain-containing protein [Clostridia bacterium]